MSPKARKTDKAPFEWKTRHVLIGVGVVLVSAIVAIVIFTLAGGSSVSKEASAQPPAPTPIGPASRERSPAADVLGATSWDDMTPQERALVRNEVSRLQNDGHFRFSTPRIPPTDEYRAGGHTFVTRSFQAMKTAGTAITFAESLTFYCPTSPTAVSVYRYKTLNANTELTQADTDIGHLPWDAFVSNVDWTQVLDRGFSTIDGRRVHELEMPFTAPGKDTATASRYWIDVETAQLLRRSEALADGTFPAAGVYDLDWRQYPPPAVPGGQEKPGCVDTALVAFSGKPEPSATSADNATTVPTAAQ